MKAIPIYIQQLVVENIKTFEARTMLQLSRPEGEISQWTLLLGDNGIGKSTLLQLIAWMKPSLPYDIADASKYLVPAPLINDEENEVLERLVHKAGKGTRTAKIRAVFVADQQLDKPLKTPLITCETEMTIAIDGTRKLEVVSPNFKTKKKSIFYRDEVVVYAY